MESDLHCPGKGTSEPRVGGRQASLHPDVLLPRPQIPVLPRGFLHPRTLAPCQTATVRIGECPDSLFLGLEGIFQEYISPIPA